jgi:TFIIH basal transcription factor complex TTD-A subunit
MCLHSYSDIPVKQLILMLNERQNFVISDLDDTHLLVDPAFLEFIQKEVTEKLEKNIYTTDKLAK